MKYFLIIIATLVFQISRVDASSTSRTELREQITKQERDRRYRENIGGCYVIACKLPSNDYKIRPTTPEEEILEELDEHAASTFPLKRSVAFNDIVAVRCLLEDVSITFDSIITSEGLYTKIKTGSLYLAVKYNFIEIASLLIKHGAEVNDKNLYGENYILRLAESRNFKEIVNLLRVAGAR